MATKKVRRNAGTNRRFEDTVNSDTSGEIETENPQEVSHEEETLIEQPATIEDFADSETESNALFDIPAETPKKRGRRKGSTNRKKVTQPTEQTAEFVTSLIDGLGMTFAGEDGTLTPTERTLLTMSLNEVSTRYSAQVEKYSGYIYPVCGVIALGMWGKRVIEIRRANNERQTTAQTGQQPNPAGVADNPIGENPNSGQQSTIIADVALANGVARPF